MTKVNELLKLEDNIIISQKKLDVFIEAVEKNAILEEYHIAKPFVNNDHFYRRVQRLTRELERLKKKLLGKTYEEPKGSIGPQFILTKIFR